MPLPMRSTARERPEQACPRAASAARLGGAIPVPVASNPYCRRLKGRRPSLAYRSKSPKCLFDVLRAILAAANGCLMLPPYLIPPSLAELSRYDSVVSGVLGAMRCEKNDQMSSNTYIVPSLLQYDNHAV